MDVGSSEQMMDTVNTEHAIKTESGQADPPDRIEDVSGQDADDVQSERSAAKILFTRYSQICGGTAFPRNT